MKLRSEETIAEGLKRLAREELDDASGYLAGGPANDLPRRVHEARKCLKKARATLRLVRKEVGEEFFARENERMRNAGRLLSPAREATVAVNTLTDLVGRGGLGATDLRPLHAVLAQRRELAHRELEEGEQGLRRAAAQVAEARAMVDAWPIGRVDAKAFEASLRKSYKRARKAWKKAYADPSPERFHELRKRCKYLWYYSRILEPSAPKELAAIEGITHEVSDLLGLDHDLADLGAAIGGRRGAAAGAALDSAERKRLRERLEAAIEQDRLRLQWRAVPLLRRLFAEKPKDFSTRLAVRFDTWRRELGTERIEWLTPSTAARIRRLIERKAGAGRSEQDRIREELRTWDVELSRWAEAVAGAGSGFRPEHFDELVERGVIRIGTAGDFDESTTLDGLHRLALDVGPNEASAISPIESAEPLAERGWDAGFWIVLDDTGIEGAIVAVGRRSTDYRWEAKRLAATSDGAPPTDDAEDCVRIGEWVYAFGSHYGSKEGPIERERQFVARFREADLARGELDLQVAGGDYRLHRLLNDALLDSGIELFPLADSARSALVGPASEEEAEEAADGRDPLVRPHDLAVNIEGCALRSRTGGVLIGLRFPTSAAGHPLIVELEDLHELFDPSPSLPTVKGVWECVNIGNAQVPAGIRGLAEGAGDVIEAITGNLDSAGKGSVLIDAHPEAALAPSAHFSLRMPANRRRGAASSELVREFHGRYRVEGVAHDPAGRTFYVIDDDERVELRFDEPAFA